MEDVWPFNGSFMFFISNHAFELTVMFFGAVLSQRVLSIPIQCGCDSYFLRSATSHTAGERSATDLTSTKDTKQSLKLIQMVKIHSNDRLGREDICKYSLKS